MTVNPKKMRPYDEPPRRRRTLIPDRPDSAAVGFFVAAAVWLVIATGIGVLAIGIRIIPFEYRFPIGILDLGFALTERRVDYAFVNATVYGWLTNAGFAAVAFMAPRLFGRRLAGEKLLNVALAIWNLSVAGGIAALYVLEIGPHAPLTAFPWFISGGLATGALVVTAVFLLTAGPAIRSAYISTWFAGVALLGLLGLTGIAATLGLVDFIIDLPELTVALVSVFVERAVSVLWLLGMAYAVLHYVVPRTAAQPLASGGLALLTWLAWLVAAPLSALVELRDPTVPFIVTTVGAVGTMLLLLPVSLAVINLSLTLQGRWTLLFGTGPAAFAAVALAFLLAVHLLQAIGALQPVRIMVGGTEWELGVFVWMMYGAFTMAAFALAEHGLPRILRRAWGGGLLSSAQLWLVFGGATIAGVGLIGGGMAQGSLLVEGTAPEAIPDLLIGYRLGAFLGFAMVALGGLATIASLFLMYTSARPANYAVPGSSTATAAGH